VKKWLIFLEHSVHTLAVVGIVDHCRVQNVLHIHIWHLANFTFTALTLSVGQQEGHPACKKSSYSILQKFTFGESGLISVPLEKLTSQTKMESDI